VRVFAAIFVLAVMGVLLFWVVSLAERLAIPWHSSQKEYLPTA
jgi:NitT/TauT family transport system permease protein